MMNKNNKPIFILLSLSFVLIIGVIAENVYTYFHPKGATIVIDVEKVKEEINKAGLKPIEAKHWKQL